SLQQVGDNTFLNELTVDGRRTYFRDIEVVAIEGHADAADPVEQTGNLDRGARSGGGTGDLLHKSAICIQEIQRAIVKRTSWQRHGFKPCALPATDPVKDTVQDQCAASGIGCENEAVNARGSSNSGVAGIRHIHNLLPACVGSGSCWLARYESRIRLETIGQ